MLLPTGKLPSSWGRIVCPTPASPRLLARLPAPGRDLTAKAEDTALVTRPIRPSLPVTRAGEQRSQKNVVRKALAVLSALVIAGCDPQRISARPSGFADKPAPVARDSETRHHLFLKGLTSQSSQSAVGFGSVCFSGGVLWYSLWTDLNGGKNTSIVHEARKPASDTCNKELQSALDKHGLKSDTFLAIIEELGAETIEDLAFADESMLKCAQEALINKGEPELKPLQFRKLVAVCERCRNATVDQHQTDDPRV
jgi:hypothetical protein